MTSSTGQGFQVIVMTAASAPLDRREAWVVQKIRAGIDVLICHPRLVKTGLDLVDFPTIGWYETDYSVYTMRQASRRSWRIGQTRPVKVVFFAYRNTLQADALKLVAKKLQSSLAVEGELPEDGLAANGDDLLPALARQVVNGATDGETVDVFAQATTAAAAAEELLVDDGWLAAEVEPEAVAVNGHGATGNRLSEAIDLGPSVDPVLGNGRPANGNGHHAEAPAPQPSLFSGAEFMAEEPVKPKRRCRKAQAPALSLFERALEQERAVEPAGSAG